MDLFLASSNLYKVGEFQALLACDEDLASRIRIRSARELGGMPSVVEDSGTFEGNALKKARALAQLIPDGTLALADDSGVCVDALGGAPGVESAYYAGPQADPVANLRKLAEVMRDVPDGRRGARFVCVLCLAGRAGEPLFFRGTCEGTLLHNPLGDGGFGYDPLFVPAGHTRSYAELGDAVKHRLSHRASAWRQLASSLRQLGCAQAANRY